VLCGRKGCQWWDKEGRKGENGQRHLSLPVFVTYHPLLVDSLFSVVLISLFPVVVVPLPLVVVVSSLLIVSPCPLVVPPSPFSLCNSSVEQL